MESIHTELEFDQSKSEKFERDFAAFYAKNYAISRSQLGQDLLALFAFGDTPGVFIDIGAADPTSINNTKLLEDMGWNGVLVEPNPSYAAFLERERKATLIAKAITPGTSGYAELELVDNDPEFSRLSGFNLDDLHDAGGKRQNSRTIAVETISVFDLAQIIKSNFGKVDFVSMDIEGLEFSVLEKFPFSELKPTVLCVEHNHSGAESEITNLLASHGYVRICKNFSKWDAWFISMHALQRDFHSDRKVDAEPVISSLRGDNIIEIARNLYDQSDFSSVISIIEAKRQERHIDYVAFAMLARAYFHQAAYSECIDVCRDAVRALRSAGQSHLAEKHILSISKNAVARLNELRRVQPLKFATSDLSNLSNLTELSALRATLHDPHTLEANRLYVARVCEQRKGMKSPDNLPSADDYEGRIRLAHEGFGQLRNIRRVDGAGTVSPDRFGDIQHMFNGVKVPADAYYGQWMTRLIAACEGHHEPQEEYVFNELLKTISNDSTMIELGSYWAFYTSWFLSEKGGGAKATIVEPDPKNLAVGLETLRLNDITASTYLGCIAAADTQGSVQFGSDCTYKAPIFDIKQYINDLGTAVDILHADIQGAEDILLSEIRECIDKALVRNLVISTHGIRKHHKVLKMLSDFGFYIVCDVDPLESYSFDGLIVARHHTLPVIGYIDVPRWNGELSKPTTLTSPANQFILLENTITAGVHPKREVYNGLKSLGLDVCIFGEKLKGEFYIPYKPDNSANTDIALDPSIFELEHKAINIWQVCRGNIGYDIPSFALETASAEELSQLKRLLARAINFIDFFEQVIINHRPAAAVVWGGIFLEPVIIAILCKRYGIPVFAIEFSFDANRIHFDKSGRIGNDFSFNEKWRESRHLPLTDHQNTEIDRWISENYRGKSKSQPTGALSESILRFISSASQKPLLLLGQCFIDTVITFDNPHFRNAEDAYFAVIDICKANKIPLIIKSHPGDREIYKLRLRDKCANHDLLYYVGLESDENVYHLMDACAAGITINSQAGLEMLSKQKPVLNLGRSFYGEAGLSMVLESPQQLEERISALVQRANSDNPPDILCKKYLYRLLHEHLIDLGISHENTTRSIGGKLREHAPQLQLHPLAEVTPLQELKTNSKLRIVILHASPSWGGSGFYLQDLAMEFRRLGHEVIILAEGTCAPYDRGVRWRSLEFQGQLLSQELREELRAFDPNVIFEAGVRTKPMRAALELSIAHDCLLIVQGEDDEFIPFQQKYPGGNLEILDILDKEILTSADVTTMLKKISLPHLVNVFTDPQFDRWVDPILRSILYHKADRFTAIWNPMLSRLEERFGTTGDLLPPIVRFEDYDLTPLSESARKQLLADLQVPDDCIVYFVNGTIYRYSDESKIFVEALNLLQAKTSRSIVLLVLGELDIESQIEFQYRCLGRLGTEAYTQYIKLADVICAPGVPDSFNRYRLSSRLIKGMMQSKPIFTFKTGFAESLEDDRDGFFTHTKSPEEWCDVLERTLCPEARLVVGARGSALAADWFDAASTASRLSESWSRLLASRTSCKPIITGVLSDSHTYDTLQKLYERRIPYRLRSQASPQLQRKEILHERLNQWALLLYGFSKLSIAAGAVHPLFYAHRAFTGIAISPNRSNNQIGLIFRHNRKACHEESEFMIWSRTGEVASRKYIENSKLVVEFESEDSDFIIYKPTWYRGKNMEKVFFELLDVKIEPRAKFDAPYARLLKDRRNQLAAEKKRLKNQIAEKKRQLVEEAIKQFESRNYANAELSLKQLAKENPKESSYLRALSEAQFSLGKRAEAISTLQMTLKLTRKKGSINRRLREMSRPNIVLIFLKGKPFPIRLIDKGLTCP